MNQVIPWGRAHDVCVIYDPVQAITKTWVADRDGGVRLIDTASPTRPIEIGGWSFPFPASAVGNPMGISADPPTSDASGNDVFVVGDQGVFAINTEIGPRSSFIAREDPPTQAQPENRAEGFSIKSVFENNIDAPLGGWTRTVYAATKAGLRMFRYDLFGGLLPNATLTFQGSFPTDATVNDPNDTFFEVEISQWTQACNRVAQLNALDGTFDRAFSPNVNSVVYSLAFQGTKTIVGGAFTTVNGSPRNRIARLNSDGTLDGTFLNGLSGANSIVYSAAIDTSDALNTKTLIAGAFTQVNSAVANRSRIARLNQDGTLDTTFQNAMAGADNTVRSVIRLSTGKILIGGLFNNVNGVARRAVARLNADGSIDNTFLNGASGLSGSVYSMAVQSDGKIVIAGSFTFADGFRKNIARLNADGSFDSTFLSGQVGASSIVNSVMTFGTGASERILVGGGFATFNGSSMRALVLLSTSGSIDLTFNPPQPAAGAQVYTIGRQSSGKIVIGGTFTSLGGQNQSYIARLNSDGTQDFGFVAGMNSSVQSWLSVLTIAWCLEAVLPSSPNA
jgi:uncharacterized delta-60 repeat protein